MLILVNLAELDSAHYFWLNRSLYNNNNNKKKSLSCFPHLFFQRKMHFSSSQTKEKVTALKGKILTTTLFSSDVESETSSTTCRADFDAS